MKIIPKYQKGKTIIYNRDNAPSYTLNNVKGFIKASNTPEGRFFGNTPIPTYNEYIAQLKEKSYLGYPYNPNWKSTSVVIPSTVREEGQKAKNFVLSYINSEGYKNRTKLNPKQIQFLYRKVRAVPINYIQNNKVNNATYVNNSLIGKIDVYSGLKPEQFGGLQYVIGHELGHAADMGQRNDIFAKKLKNTSLSLHDRRPVETYADLMAFRIALYRMGIYDSRKKEPFTKEHLKRARKSGVYNKKGIHLEEDINKSTFPKTQDFRDFNGKYFRILNQLPDEDIITLMNTIAMNEDSQDGTLYLT